MLKEQSPELVLSSNDNDNQRLSHLQAPTMALKGGHKKEVLNLAFNSDGTLVASAGADKTICILVFSHLIFFLYNQFLVIWNVYGNCENTLLIKGPSAAITDVRWNILQEYAFFTHSLYLFKHFSLYLII